MNVKEHLLLTAFQILNDERAMVADKELAGKVRAELEIQHIYENDLVLVLYEAVSASGCLMDRVKLIKKDQLVQMTDNQHLDLISEEWDRQARELAWRIAEKEPVEERESYYQRLRYDPNIGLCHLICSDYSEQFCAALSSVAANLIKPERWRYCRENCLSSTVFNCQPQERIYRLLTRHLKTEPHWNCRAIRSELLTRKPFWPTCAPIYDERDRYLSHYPCLVSLCSNLQLYRRIKDIQKDIKKPADAQTIDRHGLDFSLLQEPKVFVGFNPPSVDFSSLLDDDEDLPL